MADLERKKAVAEGLNDLQERIEDAETVSDVPVLTELFNHARTSNKRSRDGRYVALYDYDTEQESWECRSVAWLQKGTHYRDTGADLVLWFIPKPFMSSSYFFERVRAELRQKTLAAEENVAELESSIKRQKSMKARQ